MIAIIVVYFFLALQYAGAVQTPSLKVQISAEVHRKRDSLASRPMSNVSSGNSSSSSEQNSSVKRFAGELRGTATFPILNDQSSSTPPNLTAEALANLGISPTLVSQNANFFDSKSIGPIAAMTVLRSHMSTERQIFIALFFVALILAVAGCARSRELFRRVFERLYCVDTIPFLTLGLVFMWLLGSFLGSFAQIVAVGIFVSSLGIDFVFFSKYESERDLSGDAWHAERAEKRRTLGWASAFQKGNASAAPWQKYSSNSAGRYTRSGNPSQSN